MKIGILGGTFNPIHKGHFYIADVARRALSLNCIWFMPTACSPFKQQENILDFEKRIQILQSAISGDPNSYYYISRYEGLKGGISYTVDTLAELKMLHPQDYFYFILGQDSFLSFDDWKEPVKILDFAELIIISRPGYTLTKINMPKSISMKVNKVHEIAVDGVNISSTEIRKRISEGTPWEEYVPLKAVRFIKNHSLYINE